MCLENCWLSRFLARFLSRDAKYSLHVSPGRKFSFAKSTGTKTYRFVGSSGGFLFTIFFFICLFLFWGGTFSSVYRIAWGRRHEAAGLQDIRRPQRSIGQRVVSPFLKLHHITFMTKENLSNLRSKVLGHQPLRASSAVSSVHLGRVWEVLCRLGRPRSPQDSS